MNSKHVAVLMGGWVAERPVSLSSGNACADALESAGYRVSKVDVDRNVSTVLAELEPDVAFNALHGPFGEDGCIQGILEFLEIPYTHSGVMASSLAMNKDKAKAVLKAAGVPVTEHKVVHRMDIGNTHPMDPPYVLKPINEGSSFGVMIVKSDRVHPPQELTSDAWAYSDILLAEKFVPGKELTCAVLGESAMEVTEIIPNDEHFYNYEAKYNQGGSQHIIPADIPSSVYQFVRNAALTAHESLGCRGVTRADFRFDDQEDGVSGLKCLEVNTQPGMTPTSLVPELAAHDGRDFEALVSWLVEDASCNR